VGEPAIELAGLGRRFGERTALRDVTLTVPEGATLVVLGPNGAGKSTLLRVLAGLLRPHAGTVRILGRELPDEGWAVRGRIGLLAHEPMLYRDLTPRENLRFHARLHDVPLERIDEVLDAVGMTARADDPVAVLSRGMVQRVAAARAVLHDPELLLLDEPLAAVDIERRRRILPYLERVRDQLRVPIVYVTHDPGEARQLASEVIVLENGRVVGREC